MKFSQLGRITLASVLSLAGCLGISACTTAYTGAYLYVTSTKSNPGLVNAFKVDSVSGALFPLPDSPFPSGGRNPVALVVSPNNKYIYVVNHDDSSVVEYAVGTDGKIYSQNTYNTTGSFPTAIAIDPSGKFLLVAFTYQQGFTNASPGPGGVDVFPINSDGSLVNKQLWHSKAAFTVGQLVFDGKNVERVLTAGTSGASQPAWNPSVSGATNDGSVIWINEGPTTTSCNSSAPCLSVAPVGCNPVGINVSAKSNFVYVLDQNLSPSPATCTATSSTPASSPIANQPLILGFSLDTSNTTQGGALTPIPGNDATGHGFTAGVQPSAIITNTAGQNVYVTDEASNLIYSYSIQSNGSLTPNGGPFTTGASPISLTIDPLGRFLYVANYNANTIGMYNIGTGGTLSSAAGSASVGVGTNPSCVTTASRGQFVYTANYTSNNVSALQLDTSTNSLINIQNTPFSTSGFPTCAAAVIAAGH